MTPLILCLVCIWPTHPASRADTYALITAVKHVGSAGVEHVWPVVIGNGFVLRADPFIVHITGWPCQPMYYQNNQPVYPTYP